MMYIVGIDYSKNAPGIVKLHLDDQLNDTNIDWLGFTQTKKNSNDHVLFHHKKQFNNDYDKCIWIRERIKNFFLDDNEPPKYVAFEGYSYNSTGKVFDIAEGTMCTKLMIYENNIPIRIYDPNSIKKFATGNGNSGKVEMIDYFKKYIGLKPNIDKLPDYKSPTEDIIDSFWCVKLLQLELKLRYGLVQLNDLHLKQIEIFNRVTKSNPENILVQSFLQKEV